MKIKSKFDYKNILAYAFILIALSVITAYFPPRILAQSPTTYCIGTCTSMPTPSATPTIIAVSSSIAPSITSTSSTSTCQTDTTNSTNSTQGLLRFLIQFIQLLLQLLQQIFGINSTNPAVAPYNPCPTATPGVQPTSTPSVSNAPSNALSPTTDPTTISPTSTTTCRNAWKWPCSAESVWNMPIGSGAQYSSETDPRVVSLRKHGGGSLNTTSWGVAVYKTNTTDPDVTLLPSSSYSSYVWNGKNIVIKGQAGMQLPAATGKAYDLDDGFINIVQPDDQTDYETSFAEKPSATATTIKTGPVYKWDIRASCRAENGFNGGYMAGPTIAGLIRTWEMEGTNEVRHSLIIALCADQLKRGYIWPATFEDNLSIPYSGAVPIGTTLAIPPSVNIESLGLNQYGKKIGYALQRYGGIVSLQGCGPVMVGEPGLEANGIASSIRSNLGILYSQMVVLTNASQATPKGGGTSSSSAPPPFCAP